MKRVNVMFVGGARRVTLAEQIRDLEKGMLDVEFISVERDESFYPISSIARVIAGPKFGTLEFDEFLYLLLKSGNTIPIMCMDKPIPSLSKFRGMAFGTVTVVAHTLEGALTALDKRKTLEFCKSLDIKHPRVYNNLKEINSKVIVKPIEGFGSRGIFTVDKVGKTHAHLLSTHIFQEFISGQETTHDLYIDSKGELYASSRDRLAVIDGEVDHCIVRKPYADEIEMFRKIAKSSLFWGPLTVQTIRSSQGCFLIEINARLGGGVTASIFAGFPVIELLLKESIGLDIPFRGLKKVEMRRARRDFYRILEEY